MSNEFDCILVSSLLFPAATCYTPWEHPDFAHMKRDITVPVDIFQLWTWTTSSDARAYGGTPWDLWLQQAARMQHFLYHHRLLLLLHPPPRHRHSWSPEYDLGGRYHIYLINCWCQLMGIVIGIVTFIIIIIITIILLCNLCGNFVIIRSSVTVTVPLHQVCWCCRRWCCSRCC